MPAKENIEFQLQRFEQAAIKTLKRQLEDMAEFEIRFSADQNYGVMHKQLVALIFDVHRQNVLEHIKEGKYNAKLPKIDTTKEFIAGVVDKLNTLPPIPSSK